MGTDTMKLYKNLSECWNPDSKRNPKENGKDST